MQSKAFPTTGSQPQRDGAGGLTFLPSCSCEAFVIGCSIAPALGLFKLQDFLEPQISIKDIWPGNKMCKVPLQSFSATDVAKPVNDRDDNKINGCTHCALCVSC